MKNIFYRISYNKNPETPINLYGHASSSLPQTLAELQAFGITKLTLEFLDEEAIKADANNPYIF